MPEGNDITPELFSGKDDIQDTELFNDVRVDILNMVRQSDARLLIEWRKGIDDLPLVRELFSTGRSSDSMAEFKKMVIIQLDQWAVTHPLRPISALYTMVPAAIAQTLLNKWMLEMASEGKKKSKDYGNLLGQLRGIVRDFATITGFSLEVSRSINLHMINVRNQAYSEAEEIFIMAVNSAISKLKAKNMINDLLEREFERCFTESVAEIKRLRSDGKEIT